MGLHTCVNCGVSVGDSAKSCPSCGTVKHRFSEEPLERCQICDELARRSELTGYSPRSGRGGMAHEACLSRYFNPPPFRCSDCGRDFTPPGGWKEFISKPPERWPMLSPLVCPHCHGQTCLEAQGHCNQCGLYIFMWHKMVQDKKNRIDYHVFCKKAHDNHRQRIMFGSKR